ncbi:MAG: TonB family protein [Xylophilus ampelinus]
MHRTVDSPAIRSRRLLAAVLLGSLQACAGGPAPVPETAAPAREVTIAQMRPVRVPEVRVPVRAAGERPGGGTVVLRLRADAAGAVRRAAVAEGGGDPALDGAAVRAMQGARFAEDGIALPVTMLLPLHFNAPSRAAGASAWP